MSFTTKDSLLCTLSVCRGVNLRKRIIDSTKILDE